MQYKPAKIQSSALQDAVVFAAVPQVALFIFGVCFTLFGSSYVWGVAIVASCLWSAVMMWIEFAHNGRASKRAVQVVKWSYFPLLAVSSPIWTGIVEYCS